MSIFRRKSSESGAEDDAVLGESVEDVQAGGGSRQPPTGPFDVSQVEDDEMRRIDFGSLLVPAVDGLAVRVEMGDQEEIVAVSVMLQDTAIQLQAFAAPRGESMWDEVRQEIAEGIRATHGTAREASGPFGRELRADVPTADPQSTGTDGGASASRESVRFIGVDGPRWFLRGVMSGVGVGDPERAAAVESVFRGIAVRRGDHPAPPRDLLPLQVPEDPGLVSEPPADND